MMGLDSTGMEEALLMMDGSFNSTAALGATAMRADNKDSETQSPW